MILNCFVVRIVVIDYYYYEGDIEGGGVEEFLGDWISDGQLTLVIVESLKIRLH